MPFSLLEKDKNCSFLSDKHFYIEKGTYFENSTVVIKNFKDYDELNFNCTQKLNLFTLYFIPDVEILYNNTIDLYNLIFSIEFKNYQIIVFFRIKGFNLKSYNYNIQTYKFHEIDVLNGRFEFYINETRISQDLCLLEYFNSSFNIFGAIKVLAMEATVRYSKLTCPLVFMNTNLARLSLSQLSNSLILKNQLEFLDINQTDDFHLNNSKLLYLNIGYAFETVSSKTLNKYVFKHLRNIVVWGLVDDIETSLFLNFRNLSLFCLNIQNLGQLLQTNSEWMKYLNNHVKVNLSDALMVKKNLKNSMIFEIVQRKASIGTGLSFTQVNTPFVFL
jgi:hypothetical protein